MTQQTSPFIDAKFGWAQGESNWNFGMDENLLKFSYLFDRNIDGIVSSLPAAVNGEAYFLTTDNKLYFAVNGSFSSCPTPKWCIVRMRATGAYYQFNGASISQIDGPVEIDVRFDAIELNVTTLQNKTKGFLHTSEFALLGDGSDETVKVQNAVTAASTQGKKLIGDRTKTYKITAQITGLSNTWIEDLYLDASAMTGTKHALVFQGSLGSNSLLTVDTTENAYSITVANGAIFAADEWVLLHAETAYYPFPTYNVTKGEWLQIRTVVGNVVTFTTPIVELYTLATGGKLHKCNFVENVYLKNVRINGSGVPASTERGICFRLSRYFEVSNCVLTNLDQYECEIDMCIKFHIHHNRLRGTFYDGVTGLIFYGIVLLNACQYFTVHNNLGSRVRHLVVSTAATGGVYGQVMFGIIHDNVADDNMAGGSGRSFAFESHGTGRYLWWVNNIANGCYSWMRVEGGSDIHVLGGGCNGYAFQGLIIGGPSQTLQRVTASGFNISNYTAEVTAGLPCAVRLEVSNILTDVEINFTADRVAKANIGSAVSVGASTTMRNITITTNSSAGDVESSGSAALVTATGADGVVFSQCKVFGWRGGYSLSSNNCNVQGGVVSNFTSAVTGFGYYSNGTNNIMDGVHFVNINTPVRLDVSSANNRVRFTSTGASSPNPSNAGTNNVGWELNNSVTYDPPSLADGAGVTTTVTVTGASLGDFVIPTFSLDLQGISLTAYVSAANTVSCRFQNESGGVLDLASGTLRAKVIKA